MKCIIEKLVSHNEEAWIVKLSTEAVPDCVVLFSALHLGIIETIEFIDKGPNYTISIHQKDTKKSRVEYKIKLNKDEYSICRTSLEAIAALVTRVAMNGWFDAAHIDIEINECTYICFIVEPPLQ